MIEDLGSDTGIGGPDWLPPSAPLWFAIAVILAILAIVALNWRF